MFFSFLFTLSLANFLATSTPHLLPCVSPRWILRTGVIDTLQECVALSESPRTDRVASLWTRNLFISSHTWRGKFIPSTSVVGWCCCGLMHCATILSTWFWKRPCMYVCMYVFIYNLYTRPTPYIKCTIRV